MLLQAFPNSHQAEKVKPAHVIFFFKLFKLLLQILPEADLKRNEMNCISSGYIRAATSFGSTVSLKYWYLHIDKQVEALTLQNALEKDGRKKK